MTGTFTIIQDSREQAGYGPLFSSPWNVGTIKTGDYSIVGYEDQVAIERKSLPDLVGSLTRGRARFIRELERASAYERFYVVIEADASDILQGRFGPHAKNVSPAAIWESIIALSLRSCPFVFTGDRVTGARMTESLLVRYAKDHLNAVRDESRDVRAQAG